MCLCSWTRSDKVDKELTILNQKIVTKLSKIWVVDLESEIRDPEKTYP
jgi:hypothetical protein